MSEVQSEWIPFSKRPEWDDVKPVPQDEGPYPICPIAYPVQFKETMDYFRAVMQKDERSERVLALTDEVIQQNSANYTAWYFRRLVLEALHSDLRKELDFTVEIGRANPKNYQIWQHRRALVEKLADPSKELSFTAEMLADDGKNYHAWAHRQWILQAFDLWKDELDYTHELIVLDVRNNSAWNQRYFVVQHTTQFSPEVVNKEIKYAFTCIRKAPNNQSAWVYLKGILSHGPYANYPQVKEMCLEMKQMYISCPHVLSLLIDIYEQENNVQSLNNAIENCKVLRERVDVLHSKYWAFREQRIHTKIGNLSAPSTI